MNIDLTNDGEELAFLSGLKQYLDDKGKVLIPYPRLAGCEINLHDLYNKVTALGGYQKVTDRNLWVELLKEYNFNNISSTLSYGLKIIYQRFLEEYERVHYFGDDEGSKRPRFDVSIRVNRRSAFLSDFDRCQLGLSSSMRKNSSHNYDRLAFSLMSCLPNEVDFAINACTLLSGESRHVLRLSRCPQVLEALLLHAGIASEDLGSLAGVADTWLNQTQHDLIQFWQNTVDDDQVLNEMLYVSALCKCNCFDPLAEESSNESCADKRCSVCGLRTFKFKPRKKNTSKWPALFQSSRSAGVQDYEGQRVLQIALVLLNLSFEEFNLCLLARSKPLVRFAFLCIHSSYSALRQTGLDILGNISSKMELLSLGLDIMQCMYKVLDQCILSPDKFDKVRGYEILGNLCRSSSNKDCVVSLINDDIYSSSVQLLPLGDVELMLAALDALYHMSKLGEETCTKIMMVSGSIDTLICLITLNVRALGSECLSKIRIVKRIPPGIPATNEAHYQQPHHVASISTSAPRQSALMQSNVPHAPQQTGYTPQSVPQYPLHIRHNAPPQPLPHQSAHVVQHNTHLPQLPTHPQPSVAQVARQVAPLPSPKHPQLPHHSVPTLPKTFLQQNSSKHHPHAYTPPAVAQHTPPNSQQVPQSPGLVAQPPAHPETTHAPYLHLQGRLQQHTPQLVASPANASTPAKPAASQPPASQKLKRQKGKTKKPEQKKAKPLASSKSSVVPVYTHSEVRSEPPVFHYIPAPPSNIALNKTPESFAQLWVWANYESCGNEEGSTPRVEVFAEYAAAVTRYGMHGTKQVLPATEFGKCLQQVFPRAASRLFKDAKGQPMYHITGIRKRPTPLPVPGHHLQANQTTSENNCNSNAAEPNKTNTAGATSCSSPVANDVKPAVTSAAPSSDLMSETKPTLVGSDTKPLDEKSDVTSVHNATAISMSPAPTSSTVTSQVQSSQCKNADSCDVAEKTELPNISNTIETPSCVDANDNKSANSTENSAVVAENSSEIVSKSNIDTVANHCSNAINSKTISSNDTAQTNHCDAIKPEKVNGRTEPLEEELVKTEEKVRETSGKTSKSPPKAIEVKCNGELSADEKRILIKQNHLPSENTSHNESKQLVNGLPEDLKPELAMPKNGESHREELHSDATVNTAQPVLPPPSKVEEKVDGESLKPSLPKEPETKLEFASTASKPVAKKRSHSQSSTSSNSAPPVKIHKPNHSPKSPGDVSRPPVSTYIVRPPPIPLPPQSFYPSQTAPSLPNPPMSVPGSSSALLTHGNGPVTNHARHPSPQLPQPAPPPPQQSPLPSKLPVIDLMAPNASLLVLIRNSGKYQFDDSTDEKEDPISKSIRLTAVLILINICLYSNEGRSLLQRHEYWLAYLAMSSMDCSPMIAKLLSELDR